jgi:hypothetical protein
LQIITVPWRTMGIARQIGGGGQDGKSGHTPTPYYIFI